MSDALFPFGYGLSYTTFKIGDARFSKTTITAGEKIQLTVIPGEYEVYCGNSSDGKDLKMVKVKIL